VLVAAGIYAWRSGLALQMMGASAGAPHLSIVVLPLANLSGDPGQE
jgi:hypothetical protein